MKLKPIDQQVVVVVGCTSGIGLETAIRFAKKGAKLVLVGRGMPDLDRTLEEVRREGAEAITYETDVADWEGMQRAAQRAVDTFGRIDTWAHVAGVPYYSLLEDTPPDEFRRVIEVNLNGPTFGVMAALPILKREGRGAIIIVSSVEAHIPVPYHSAYNASKHGLEGMINTLRIELEHEHIPISVTNILPGTINTPFFMKSKTRLGFEPGVMPPVYDAASVADAIVYAAAHPTRSISVGGASLIYQATRRFNRRLNDSTIRRVAFKAQQTDIPKGPDAPNNLYTHIEGYHQVEGKYPSKYSWTTWMQLHPVITLMGGALLLVGLPVGIVMYMRSRRTPKSMIKRARMKLGDIAVISAIAGVVSNLIPKRKSLPQRVVSRAQDMLPTNFLGMRKRSMPEKFMSKVSDIMPKGISLRRQKSLPEKAMDKVKDIVPTRAEIRAQRKAAQKTAMRMRERATNDMMDGHRKSMPQRMYNTAKETVQDTISTITK